jgi:hypothetical protein
VTFDISDGDPPECLQPQADDVNSQIIESGRVQEERIRTLQARVDAELPTGTQTGDIMASAIAPILESYKEQTIQNLRCSEPKANIDDDPEASIEPKGQPGRPQIVQSTASSSSAGLESTPEEISNIDNTYDHTRFTKLGEYTYTTTEISR